MKLQLALDRLTRNDCFRIVEETNQAIDIIEVGTGVIKEYGMEIIKEMKIRYPDKILLADMKTCDAGRSEAKQAFEAGADITTVMAFSSDVTIMDTLEVAKQMNKQIMIDLLGISFQEKLAGLRELGVNLVNLHIGKDQQQIGMFHPSLFSLVNGFDFNVSVAGGVNLETLPDIITEDPDIVIVGSAITGAKNPGDAATKMCELIKGNK